MIFILQNNELIHTTTVYFYIIKYISIFQNYGSLQNLSSTPIGKQRTFLPSCITLKSLKLLTDAPFSFQSFPPVPPLAHHSPLTL